MIKLIASDMDGTLLNNKMGISPSNIAAIREAERRGIQFMVATGRGYLEAKPALDEAGISCAMITVNGAQVYNKEGRSLFTVGIESALAKQVMEILESNHIYYEIATTKGVFSVNHAQRIENVAGHIAASLPHLTYKMAIAMAAAHLELLHVQFVTDFQQLLDDPDIEIFKFICFDMNGPKVLGPIGEKIGQIEHLTVTSSGQNNIEVNHANAQKGIAVKHVAKDLGIPMEEVMTIGDNFNDESMLRVAGVSFAMGNAEPEIKEIAKYVTSTNIENGVGEAIMRAINEDL